MYDLIQLNKNGCINLQLECKVINEEVEHSKSQIRAKLLEKEKFEHDAELANQHYYTGISNYDLYHINWHMCHFNWHMFHINFPYVSYSLVYVL